MSQVIVYTNDTGGISIVIPAPECGLTIEEIAQKDVPQGVSYQIVEREALPSDRTFRNAWKADLTVDLPKARDITKERLRAERVALLAEQDIEFVRALEAGSDTKKIIAEKQRLRDITKLADVAQTPEELKAIQVAK